MILGATALCLLAGTFHVQIATQSFTLRWQHSIEKILWEEDYLITDRGLFLSEARVRGSGAGMEPPAGAILEQGVWHYRPKSVWNNSLVLARSEFVQDYEICLREGCHPLSTWIPVNAGATTLSPCKN